MKDSREVIERLIRKNKPTRMGLKDGPWGDTLRKWAADEGYPKNEKGEPREPVDVFDYDMEGVGGWFDIMPLKGVREIVEETDEWVVRRNGGGAALKWWKNHAGTPEHVDFRMTSREIWDRDYRKHLLTVDPTRIDIAAAKEQLARRRAENRWTHYGHLFIWEHMRQTMGDITMYQSLLLDPDWVHDFARVYTDFFKAHYKILFAEAGIPDGIWVYEDLGYKNGLFCSPKILDELIFPYFKELVDFFHSYNLPVVLHSCGGVEAALPGIVAAGFDGLNPMERKAGCDPLKWAEKYGDKLAFIGGCNVQVLETGDRDLIKREVVSLCEGMKERGASYVFMSDHSLPPTIRLADYRYAIDVYREHMWY